MKMQFFFIGSLEVDGYLTNPVYINIDEETTISLVKRWAEKIEKAKEEEKEDGSEQKLSESKTNLNSLLSKKTCLDEYKPIPEEEIRKNKHKNNDIEVLELGGKSKIINLDDYEKRSTKTRDKILTRSRTSYNEKRKGKLFCQMCGKSFDENNLVYAKNENGIEVKVCSSDCKKRIESFSLARL